MLKATAVIGAGYGDEGKGVVTSTLAPEHDIVVRHNGGAQAAHTVEHKGIRHVFGHFGSGTLQGKPTYLSKYFIVNPLLFRKEWNELKSKGFTPKVYMDKDAKVTLPIDMLINQQLEKKRGESGRHGSCGVGINETITRNEHYSSFTVEDAVDIMKLMERIHDITTQYSVTRCEYLQIGIEEFLEPHFYTRMYEDFYECCVWMLSKVQLVDTSILNKFDRVLFEGAQGLLLDEYFGEFPHVTRSRTGSTNIHAMISQIDIKVPLETFYVTRHFTTRHGAGPLEYECDPPEYLKDKTNVPNEWQGALRYGMLNLDKLKSAIALNSERTGLDVKNRLVVTCMDLHSVCNDGTAMYIWYEYNRPNWGSADMLINTIKRKILLTTYTTSSPVTQEVVWTEF